MPPKSAGPADPALIEDLVAANRILFDQGVVDAFGHVSVRHDKSRERYLMSRSIAPASVTADDIMEYDLDSNPVDQRDRRMYFERFIHSEMYKARPDVNAVVHSHSPTIVPFGVARTPLKPLAQVSAFLGLGVPVFEIRKYETGGDLMVRNAATGKALAQTLGKAAVVLMRGHGSTAVGKSLREVVWRAVYAEVNARQQVVAMQLGEITFLTDAEIAANAEESPADPHRAWDMWKSRALRGLAKA
jgi:HCOMODA/2-hydroxy-3-carboxy-muconic semialdehyde decarboxylase